MRANALSLACCRRSQLTRRDRSLALVGWITNAVHCQATRHRTTAQVTRPAQISAQYHVASLCRGRRTSNSGEKRQTCGPGVLWRPRTGRTAVCGAVGLRGVSCESRAKGSTRGDVTHKKREHLPPRSGRLCVARCRARLTRSSNSRPTICVARACRILGGTMPSAFAI